MTAKFDVLLVEDNPADMRLVREAFAECMAPITLHWVSTGEEALEFLRKQKGYVAAPRPSLVLLDLNLPSLKGIEVLRELKQDPVTIPVPVVILSSSNAQKDISDAYLEHANSYHVKPDDFDKYIEFVRSIESYWFQSIQLPDRPAVTSTKY